MKVLVCGSRHFQDYERLKKKLDGYNIDAIVHGEARGADTLAGRYGKERGIAVSSYPAEWDKHGKRAGTIRNTQMLRQETPELVIAFMAKDSRGTRNMCDQSIKAGVPVEIVDI